MLSDTEIIDFLQTYINSETQAKTGGACIIIDVVLHGPNITLREALSEYALNGTHDETT